MIKWQLWIWISNLKFQNFTYIANLVHMLKDLDMVFKSKFSNVTCNYNLQYIWLNNNYEYEFQI